MTRTVALIGGLAAAAIALLAGTAEAKIRCEGPVQILGNGESLPTPYCEDSYLAFVAQQHGVNVTGAAIRASYNKKTRVCELVGHDIRVSSICAGQRPVDRRGSRKIFSN